MNSVSSTLSPALAGGLPLDALQAATASASRPAASSATADTLAPAKPSSTGGAKKTAGAKTATSRTSSAKKTSTSSAKKTTSSSAKKATSTSKAGYAATASLPKELAFLRDAKLSVEEKLLRLAAYLNARSEAEIQKKMEAFAGGVAGGGTNTGGAPPTGAKPKPKKKGFWSKALDSVQVMFPAVGLSMQLLKTPATRNALKQVGGPVLAAAATALGFPQAAPALLRYGPGVVDLAAGALQAVERAASAEDKAAAEPAAAAPGSASSRAGDSGAASGTGAAKNEQYQMLELTRLLDQQKLLMSTLSNVLKSMHDTKSHIIGNLR